MFPNDESRQAHLQRNSADLRRSAPSTHRPVLSMAEPRRRARCSLARRGHSARPSSRRGAGKPQVRGLADTRARPCRCRSAGWRVSEACATWTAGRARRWARLGRGPASWERAGLAERVGGSTADRSVFCVFSWCLHSAGYLRPVDLSAADNEIAASVKNEPSVSVRHVKVSYVSVSRRQVGLQIRHVRDVVPALWSGRRRAWIQRSEGQR